MNWLVFFLADYFLFWAIPLILILAETANHFRRTGKRPQLIACALLCLLFIGLTIAYFVGNGFSNLRPLLEGVDRDYRK